MRTIVRLILGSCLLSALLAARAGGGPEKSAPSTSTGGGARRPAAAVTRAAVVPPGVRAGVRAQAPLSAGDRELREIQAEGRRQVAALANRIATLPDGPARAELERHAQQVKLDTELRFLARLAQLARSRGDAALAGEAERAAEGLRNPGPAPVEGAAAPAPPAKPAPKGGRP